MSNSSSNISSTFYCALLNYVTYVYQCMQYGIYPDTVLFYLFHIGLFYVNVYANVEFCYVLYTRMKDYEQFINYLRLLPTQIMEIFLSFFYTESKWNII